MKNLYGAMNMIRVNVEVRNPSSGESVGLRGLLVDTGATYTMLPVTVLRELGVRPLTTDAFELADGRVVNYPCGRVKIALDRGPEATCKVIFGPEHGGLVGSNTLEKWGVLLDVRSGRLLPRNDTLNTEPMENGPPPVRGMQLDGLEIPKDVESRIIGLEETQAKIDAARARTAEIRQKSFRILDDLVENAESLSGDAIFAVLDGLDTLIEGAKSISDSEAVSLFDAARSKVELSVTRGRLTRH